MAEEKDDQSGGSPPSTSPKQEHEQEQAHDGQGAPDDKKRGRPERTATFQDYMVRLASARNCKYDDADFSQRIFSYANKWDFAAYAAGILAAVGAGVTMPLMTVIFGTATLPVLFVG
jgi:hypothetical protein